MERKVGEVFEVNGVKLKCVKYNHNCKDCYFHGKIIQCFRQKCNCLYRKDLKDVMFIRIEDKIMAKNIKIEYKNGVADHYVTQKTEDLNIPSLGFDTEEEAELAIAVAKTLKVYNKDIINLDNIMSYVLRILGIRNGWTE